MPTKAVLLVRVSDHRQEKEGLSLDNQEEILRRYAEEHGLEVVREFRFQESADHKIRTRFMEMVSFVKRRRDVTAIISYRVDRLTRNYRDHVLMDDLRLEHGKELHCVYDRLTIDKRTVGRDIQDWDTKVFLAKQYLNRLKEDARNSAGYKLRHGEWPGKAPFGYRNQKSAENRNWIYPDAFKAEVVRSMYQAYATASFSMKQIRQKIKAEYGVSLSTGHIDQILKNPFYYGEMMYDEKRYRHVYEPLILRGLFDRVQAIKAGYHKQPYKYGGLPFLYRGIFLCGTCGCRITPERKRKKSREYRYYHCTEYRGKHDACWMREEEITAQLQRLFDVLHVPEPELRDLVTTLRQSYSSKTEFSDDLVKELQASRNRYEHRIRQMYEDKLDGTITADYFEEKREEYRAKQRGIDEKLSQIESADDEYFLTAATLLEIASRSGELFAVSKLEEKRQLLNMLLQNCVIEDGNLVWELRKPYDTIFQHAQNSNWLRLVDVFRRREAEIDPTTCEMAPMLRALMNTLLPGICSV